MSKLTLSVDERVVSRAKRYAKQRGVPVSSMVEACLASVAAPASEPEQDTPILRRVRGALEKGDRETCRRQRLPQPRFIT